MEQTVKIERQAQNGGLFGNGRWYNPDTTARDSIKALQLVGKSVVLVLNDAGFVMGVRVVEEQQAEPKSNRIAVNERELTIIRQTMWKGACEAIAAIIRQHPEIQGFEDDTVVADMAVSIARRGERYVLEG